MKTPREWSDDHMERYIGYDAPLPEWIKEVQRDATEEWKQEVRRLNHNIEVYKERWHHARRYLRAANKGAERNNQIMRLQSYDISRLRERIKQLEQHNQ